MNHPPTPGQTVGPFFGFALPLAGGAHLLPPGASGAVQLTGRVLDAAGSPVTDALVETWQADGQGRVLSRPGSLARDGHTFTGWGRCPTDGEGRYSFTTLRPGAVADHAPFFAVAVFARGLLDRLLTRAYLPAGDPDEQARLDADPLLASLPPERAATLMVREQGPALVWDVHLAGEHETVFLDHRAPSSTAGSPPGERP